MKITIKKVIPFIRKNSIPILISAIATSISLLVAILTNFDIEITDVGVQRQMADNLSLKDPSTWSQGFYPSLWLFIIKFLGINTWTVSGKIISAIFFGIASYYLYKSIYFFTTTKFLTILLLIAISINVEYFTVFTYALGDSAMVCIAIAGLYHFFCTKSYFLAVALISLSAQFRHHGLIILLLISIVYLLSKRHLIVEKFRFLSIAFFVYCPQLLLNLAAGKPLIYTSQSFNSYKTYFDLNPLVNNPIDHILHDLLNGSTVITKYLANLSLNYSLFIVLGVICLIGIFNSKDSFKLSLIAIVYLLIGNIGYSPRMLPFGIASAGIAFAMLFSKYGNTLISRSIVATILLFLIYDSTLHNLKSTLIRIDFSETSNQICKAILKEEPSTKLENVFVDYNSLEIDGLPGNTRYLDWTSWYRFQNKNYIQQYPGIHLSSFIKNPDSASTFAIKNGLKFLVLKTDKLYYSQLLALDCFEQIKIFDIYRYKINYYLQYEKLFFHKLIVLKIINPIN